MSNKSPIFPICEPHEHFSDYGFDPQIDYFQVLEEARKHNRESASRSQIDLHFRLQKPISKDDSSKKNKNNSKKRWWRNALLFFKFDKRAAPPPESAAWHGGATALIGSISGPVYITESTMSGSSTLYRTATRASSGELMKGEVEIPYVSLRELNMDRRQQQPRISTTAMPIYLVT